MPWGYVLVCFWTKNLKLCKIMPWGMFWCVFNTINVTSVTSILVWLICKYVPWGYVWFPRSICQRQGRPNGINSTIGLFDTQMLWTNTLTRTTPFPDQIWMILTNRVCQICDETLGFFFINSAIAPAFTTFNYKYYGSLFHSVPNRCIPRTSASE